MFYTWFDKKSLPIFKVIFYAKIFLICLNYISLNIPYTKTTHGIIGQAILRHCKPDAVILNFARGELVDSDAMKEFLDAGDGKYVTDFPEDLLWDHKNCLVLPHLGASTEEAEDAAASMAADTIRNYLENGTIVNSVNFPDTQLDARPAETVRFTVVNKNVPGALAAITEAISNEGLNIVQQINHSRGDIAYNVCDIQTTESDSVVSFKNVQEQITMVDGVISTRVIYGEPGTGYAKNVEGEFKEEDSRRFDFKKKHFEDSTNKPPTVKTKKRKISAFTQQNLDFEGRHQQQKWRSDGTIRPTSELKDMSGHSEPTPRINGSFNCLRSLGEH